MTILSLLLLQLLLERLQIPQKGLHATFKGLYPVYPKCPRMDRSSWDSFFIAHSTKFTRGSSLLLQKSLLMEKIKSRRKSLIKKKKEKSLRREKEYHSVKERKKNPSLMTTIGRASRWSPDFEQRSRVKTKFVINKVKNEVSFYLRKY